MVRFGYNPSRRNRNIGTAAQGHGNRNRLCIPTHSGDERRYWESLTSYDKSVQVVCGQEILFVTEETHPQFQHACSMDEVCMILGCIPAEDWRGIDAFVFRQPTRKQRLLEPVWGRLAMYAEIGKGEQNIYSGPAIILEAVNEEQNVRWSRSQKPWQAQELDRLRADGHIVTEKRREYIVQSSAVAAKATQLYRTMPHEIGHWVDWQQRVERPYESAQNADHTANYQILVDAYWARPYSEREAFAHRYADALHAKLVHALD